jgi:glucose-6-phosphate-specific signal transduction histidine kinase
MRTTIQNPSPMKQPLQTTFADTSVPGTSLQSMINHLLRHSLSDTLRSSSSSVMNEVPADLTIIADSSKVTTVIQELLSTILTNARKGRIHIRAERFRDIVILEIQDQSNYNGYALDCSIRAIEPMARMAGGNISIKGKQQLETTVSFSFPNQPGSLSYDC